MISFDPHQFLWLWVGHSWTFPGQLENSLKYGHCHCLTMEIDPLNRSCLAFFLLASGGKQVNMPFAKDLFIRIPLGGWVNLLNHNVPVSEVQSLRRVPDESQVVLHRPWPWETWMQVPTHNRLIGWPWIRIEQWSLRPKMAVRLMMIRHATMLSIKKWGQSYS